MLCMPPPRAQSFETAETSKIGERKDRPLCLPLRPAAPFWPAMPPRAKDAVPTGADVSEAKGKDARAKGGDKGADSSQKKAANPAGRGAASPGKKRSSFGGTQKREMRIEMLGEDTPGPGAYLPASTFARAASATSSSKKGAKVLTTSSFRSTSLQRPRAINEQVPGPGAHSPNKVATERNLTNSAPHLAAKGLRFAGLGSSDWDHAEVAGGVDPGPGEYETHKYRTIQMDANHAVKMSSKVAKGFGITSLQHDLPWRATVDDDKDLPGPGKYETNTSEISRADGHASVFRKPTERKKGQNDSPKHGVPPNVGGGKKGGSASRSRGAGGSTKGRSPKGKDEPVRV